MVKEPLQENGKSEEKYKREEKTSTKKNCAIYINYSSISFQSTIETRRCLVKKKHTFMKFCTLCELDIE